MLKGLIQKQIEDFIARQLAVKDTVLGLVESNYDNNSGLISDSETFGSAPFFIVEDEGNILYIIEKDGSCVAAPPLNHASERNVGECDGIYTVPMFLIPGINSLRFVPTSSDYQANLVDWEKALSEGSMVFSETEKLFNEFTSLISESLREIVEGSIRSGEIAMRYEGNADLASMDQEEVELVRQEALYAHLVQLGHQLTEDINEDLSEGVGELMDSIS